jgi:hypothetical protein
MDADSWLQQEFAGHPEPGKDSEASPPPEEYFPGSRVRKDDFHSSLRALNAPEGPAEGQPRAWDRNPRIQAFKGSNVEFFTIGPLAEALGKKPVTIRAWITKGWLPPARYRTAGIPGTRGDAGRRLWMRWQIETIVAVANEIGILREWAPKKELLDVFAVRVREELAKNGNTGT